MHDEIDRLRDELAQQIAPLERQHASRLRCERGCAQCCVDGITVFEVEAEVIRDRHAALLAEGAPHPEGACAFLDDERSCRIYADRPYVCRTQGLPLRWTDDEATAPDGSLGVEYRDICPLNEIEGDPPITALAPEDCWTLGPAEAELQLLQLGRGEANRVALRDLFRR